MEKKFCPNCGNELSAEAVFCPKCGTRQPVGGGNQPKGGKNTAVLAVVLALVLVAVIGVVFFVVKGKSAGNKPEEEVTAAAKAEASTQAPTKAQVQTQAQTETRTEAPTQPVASSVAAETAAEADVDFDGFWYGGRTELTIEKVGEFYYASMYVHDGAASGFNKYMTCVKKDGVLVYEDGTSEWILYSSDPNDTSYEPASIVDYSNGTGRFYLVENRETAEKMELGMVFDREDGTETEMVLVWDADPVKNRLSNEYIIWQSSQVLITEYDMPNDKNQVRLARNEIYARYGRKFKDTDLQGYFNNKSWYYGAIEPEYFNDSWLSEVEKENIKRLEAYENSLPSPSYVTYEAICTPYNGSEGLKSLKINDDGYSLELEGVINGVYQTVTLKYDKTSRFLSAGGEDPSYDVPREQFLDTVQRMNGLALYIETDEWGYIVRATLCS